MIMQPNAVHDAGRARLFYEGNRDATPLSRGADPDEIAAAVMFLLGPDACSSRARTCRSMAA